MFNKIIVPFELLEELKEEKQSYQEELESVSCMAADCSLCFEKHCPVEYITDKISEIENTIADIEFNYL